MTAVQGQLLTLFKATFKQKKKKFIMFYLLWTKHKITVILDKSHHSSFPKSIKLDIYYSCFTNTKWRITHDKWQIWKHQGKQKNVKATSSTTGLPCPYVPYDLEKKSLAIQYASCISTSTALHV